VHVALLESSLSNEIIAKNIGPSILHELHEELKIIDCEHHDQSGSWRRLSSTPLEDKQKNYVSESIKFETKRQGVILLVPPVDNGSVINSFGRDF
jgi:hypothetical protein